MFEEIQSTVSLVSEEDEKSFLKIEVVPQKRGALSF